MNDDELIERFYIESSLDDMAYIQMLKKEINYLNTRYHIRVKNKQFELADIINSIIGMYKQELDHATRSLAGNASTVSAPSAARNKRVFVLKR